jgi:hypothetical protein
MIVVLQLIKAARSLSIKRCEGEEFARGVWYASAKVPNWRGKGCIVWAIGLKNGQKCDQDIPHCGKTGTRNNAVEDGMVHVE